MPRTGRWVALLALLAVVTAPAAQASILDVPAGEESAEYLDLILNSIIGPMSAVLNIGCLLFAGLILGYTLLAGVLNSAHEGKVLGNAQNSMWAPLRMVVAVALLIPTSSGYSVSQLAIVEIAERGIGLANSTWGAALTYIDNNGTLYPPLTTRNGEKLAAAMLLSSGCLEVINQSHGETVITRRPDMTYSGDSVVLQQRYTGTGSPIFATTPSFGTPTYPLDACGSIKISTTLNDDELIQPIKTRYINAVQVALGDLEQETYDLARVMNDTINKRFDNPELDLTGNELALAGKKYDDALALALQNAVKDLNDARLSDTNWRDDVGSWLYAGRYYVDIMRLHHSVNDLVHIQPTTTQPIPDLTKNVDYTDGMELFKTYLAERHTIDEHGDVVNIADQKPVNEIFSLKTKWQKAMHDSLTEIDNPMIALQSFGHSLTNSLYAGLVATGTAKVATSGAANSLWLKIVPGGGAASGGVKELADMIFTGMGALFFFMLPVVFFLIIYLPTMPYVLWIMGLAGWFVLFLEALVAAPIWAAAHSIPDSNSSAINHHARAGYMILLSLFMRPTLMLFGLFGGMLLSLIIAKIAFTGFIPMAVSVSGEHMTGLITLVGFIIVLVMMMVSIMHRSYGLIHELPDKVLRYIGGMGEMLGESQSEQQGRTMVVGAVAKVSQRGEQGMSRGGGAGGNGASDNGGGSGNSITPSQKSHSPV